MFVIFNWKFDNSFSRLNETKTLSTVFNFLNIEIQIIFLKKEKNNLILILALMNGYKLQWTLMKTKI